MLSLFVFLLQINLSMKNDGYAKFDVHSHAIPHTHEIPHTHSYVSYGGSGADCHTCESQRAAL